MDIIENEENVTTQKNNNKLQKCASFSSSKITDGKEQGRIQIFNHSLKSFADNTPTHQHLGKRHSAVSMPDNSELQLLSTKRQCLEFHNTLIDRSNSQTLSALLQEKLEKSECEKEQLRKQLKELQDEMGRRKSQFKSVWQHAPLYPDWRKEEFQTVNLTLDTTTAHPALFLSENGSQVTWHEKCQDVPSSPQRFYTLPCVLGQLNITSRRYYWRVDVKDVRSWDLGICRDTVTRKGKVTMSPNNGFWAIRLYNGEYWALTNPETHLTLREKPLSVGIFVDYEAGDVSFYNMTNGAYIFSFSSVTFGGVLRPLFRLWPSSSGSLTIPQN